MFTVDKQADRKPSQFQRLGYGLETIAALGTDSQRQQHYVGSVFSYSVSKHWIVHIEEASHAG